MKNKRRILDYTSDMLEVDNMTTYLPGLRALHNLTQEDVAEYSRVSASSLSEIERGLKKPSIMTLTRIKLAFEKMEEKNANN